MSVKIRVSCICFIKVFFLRFYLILSFHFFYSFILLDCFGFYVLDETALSPRLERVASYRGGNLSFILVLALGCLSNLWDCASGFLIMFFPADPLTLAKTL